MLIARIKPVMHVRYTRGHQLCYKDHIINLPQDITEVAERLPRLPQDLDIVIIRRREILAAVIRRHSPYSRYERT
jgi:hypothetical protein